MDEATKKEAIRRIRLTHALNNPIPFKSGRPDRDTRIRKEDVINLKILLNTSKSLEEFLYQC